MVTASLYTGWPQIHGFHGFYFFDTLGNCLVFTRRTARYGTVPYGTVPYCARQYRTVPYRTVLYCNGTVPYSTVRYGSVRHSMC